LYHLTLKAGLPAIDNDDTKAMPRTDLCDGRVLKLPKHYEWGEKFGDSQPHFRTGHACGVGCRRPNGGGEFGGLVSLELV